MSASKDPNTKDGPNGPATFLNDPVEYPWDMPVSYDSVPVGVDKRGELVTNDSPLSHQFLWGCPSLGISLGPLFWGCASLGISLGLGGAPGGISSGLRTYISGISRLDGVALLGIDLTRCELRVSS
jgi:hypothetical protein